MQPLAKLFFLLVFAALITFLVLSNQGCEKNEDCENNLAHNLVGRTSCIQQSCTKPATSEKKEGVEVVMGQSDGCDNQCEEGEKCVDGVCLKVGGCAEQGNCPDPDPDPDTPDPEHECPEPDPEPPRPVRDPAMMAAFEKVWEEKYPLCNEKACNESIENYIQQDKPWNVEGTEDGNFNTCKYKCPVRGFKREGCQRMVLHNDEWVNCSTKDDCYFKAQMFETSCNKEECNDAMFEEIKGNRKFNASLTKEGQLAACKGCSVRGFSYANGSHVALVRKDAENFDVIKCDDPTKTDPLTSSNRCLRHVFIH